MATRSRRTSKASVNKPKRTSGRNEGLGHVDQHIKRQEEKRAASRTGWVKFPDDEDEPVVLRAWDPSLFRDGYIHKVEFKGRRGTFERDVMCLDQEEEGEPCPGCADELERRYKFWFPVIQRDAPITNDKGKVIGYKDQVMILSSSSSRLSKALNRVQKKYGLKGQDIEVTRTGTGFDTQYEIERLEKEPLSSEDKELIAAFDADAVLERYTKMKDEDSFYELDDKDGDDDGDDPGERSKRRGSPFGARSKKKGSSRRARDEDDDDADDDEDDEPRPRQRRSSRAKAGTRKPGGLGALAAKKGSKSSSGKSSSKTTTVRRRRSR